MHATGHLSDFDAPTVPAFRATAILTHAAKDVVRGGSAETEFIIVISITDTVIDLGVVGAAGQPGDLAGIVLTAAFVVVF